MKRLLPTLIVLGTFLSPVGLPVAVAQEVVTDESRARQLHNQGLEQFNRGQYQAAYTSWQTALEIFQATGTRERQVNTLNNLGTLFRTLGQAEPALDYHQQSLAIAREFKNAIAESHALTGMGQVYDMLGQYPQAIDHYEQALALNLEPQDNIFALGNLGSTYLNLGQYQRAIEYYEQVLPIVRESGNRLGESSVLGNVGIAYDHLGQYQRSLSLLEQQLAITREIGYRAGESRSLGNLGNVYIDLGQYPQAIELLEQQLAITRELGDRPGEANTVGNLGNAYTRLGNPYQAVEFYQQALTIARELGHRPSESRSLGNLGIAYTRLGDYQQAIDLLEQQLTITHQLGDIPGKSRALGNLGNAYATLGDYDRAVDLFGQLLATSRNSGDRNEAGLALSNLGYTFQADEQPELAIAFFKEAVTIREGIRKDIADQGLLHSYTDTVADSYRALADLLLEQARVLEAQEVLELLKVEELTAYTDERAGEHKAKVTLLPKEKEMVETYSSLVEFGKQLQDCEAKGKQCENLSNLRSQRDDQFRQYREAVKSLKTFISDRLAEGDRANLLLNPESFSSTAKDIIDQQPGTVVIYPLVLQDKLWLLWAADGRLVGRRELAVNRQEIGKTVVRFRALLEDRTSNVTEIQTLGKQLYDWLIAPIETELTSNQDIKHLVFSPDRVLRYVPMGALYDGQHYLIEKFTVGTILSAGLTDMSRRSPVGTDGVSVLGVGVSQQVENFNALPNVPLELDAIIRDQNNPVDSQGIYPGQQLLDSDFTFDTLRDALGGQQILHIATHGESVTSRDGSYLLMGDGQLLPVQEVETLGSYMEDVHLVVLSACQTAVGTPEAEGLEVAGLSYWFLNSQIDAVMASLWNVNDRSTSLLMQRFYASLSQSTANNPVTKAEALQAAQRSFIQSTDSVTASDARIIGQRQTEDNRATLLAHPYYWAPMTLIGNTL
ncbi:MAG: tetratricopeptide repeat protein [Cyanobacteria bacterium P01_D01_bin.156]